MNSKSLLVEPNLTMRELEEYHFISVQQTDMHPKIGWTRFPPLHCILCVFCQTLTTTSQVFPASEEIFKKEFCSACDRRQENNIFEKASNEEGPKVRIEKFLRFLMFHSEPIEIT